MQTQGSASTVPSNLLQLPRELLVSILRELLLCTPYISHSGPHDLHVQVLRANKQLYSEGLRILYEENYFRMKICEKPIAGSAYFVKCDHFGEEVKYNLPQFELIQHYDIYVEVLVFKDTLSIKPAVREVAAVLSDVPRIKHLRITIAAYEGDRDLEILDEEIHWSSQVLQLFTLLRGVHRVDFFGAIQPEYAEKFKRIMEGNSPLDHLPKMYDALEKLAGPFEEYHYDLHRALERVDNYKVTQFKILRDKLTQYVVERTQYALNHLTDHDAEPDDEEWVIEKRRRR